MNDTLFSPCTLGRVALTHRVVIAPVTRNRSPGSAPGEAVARYRARRAEANLQAGRTDLATSYTPGEKGYTDYPVVG